MPDHPENEKLNEFQLQLVARRDQIRLLDQLDALEKRVKNLERCLQHYFGTFSPPPPPKPAKLPRLTKKALDAARRK